MIDQALAAFLESGLAVVVGTVSPDGEPCASRAWACEVIDAATIRMLVDACDIHLLGHGDGGAPIAVTASDVRTLRSVQLKGRVLRVDGVSDHDQARLERQCDQLFTEISTVDLVPRPLAERIRPPEYVACEMEVDELFDQTPGPGAGARVEGARS